MKVISDGMMSADNILEESLTVIDRVWVICEGCQPISEWMYTTKERKSPPVFVAECGKKVKENFIEDFGSEFPTLSSGIINGKLGQASYRLHDGMYKLGTCLQRIKGRKFMVTSDDERKELHELLLDVVADFAVYTIIAFQLQQSTAGVCTLAVSKACERRQINPGLLYGEMMETIKKTGRTYYAYEPLSPVYSDMLADEPAFLAECEALELPLTEELAKQLLAGEFTPPLLMEYLLKQTLSTEQHEVNLDPIGMIKRMNLE